MPLRPSSAFRNYPQEFPHASQKAKEAVRLIHDMMKKMPRTQIAQIADTGTHLATGYVTAQTELGVVRVVGIPLGSVVNGMRVYVRQMGGHASNQLYVFDGFASVPAGLGQSGAIQLVQSIVGQVSAVAQTQSTAPVPSVVGLGGPTGYYWHLYFYLPSLPTSVVTIMQMVQVASTPAVLLEYLPSGLLRFRDNSQSNPALCNSYTTLAPVPPHTDHFVQIQPGNQVSDLVIDGNGGNYSLFNNLPTFAGGGGTYTLSLLSNIDGSQPCPAGSWVSKIGYGASYNAGVVPLATTSAEPVTDSGLPNFSLSNTQQTMALYTCTGDTYANQLVQNQAILASGSTNPLAGPLALTYGQATLASYGPY